MKSYTHQCACCGALFVAGHRAAKWCSARCKAKASYQRRRRSAPEAGYHIAYGDEPLLPIQWRDEAPLTTKLSPFSFGEHQVRVLTDGLGTPWFVAADVCGALDIANPSQALTRLDDDEKTLISNEGASAGGPSSFNLVNEPGLYSLILGSRKPEAKRFKRWVTHEVLPAIRRTGSYGTAPAPNLPLTPGVYVVAKNARHATWIWMQAVEDQVGAALVAQIAASRKRGYNNLPFQLHLLPNNHE